MMNDELILVIEIYQRQRLRGSGQVEFPRPTTARLQRGAVGGLVSGDARAMAEWTCAPRRQKQGYRLKDPRDDDRACKRLIDSGSK